MKLRILILVFLAATLAPAAIADSIHLANGRVIFTTEARVVEGRVEFVQYGGRQAIPVEQVARIERDDRQGPASSATVRKTGPSRTTRPTPVAAAANATGVPSSEAPLPGLLSAGGGGLDLAALMGGETGGIAGAGGLAELGALLPLLTQGEPGQLDALLPMLQQIGSLLSTENPTAEGAESTLASLLAGMRGMGVTPEMIRERAAAFGLSLDDGY